jgi:hypothetical protein
VKASQEPIQIGWDINAILNGWLECIRLAPWESLFEPTQSRGRSTAALAFNVFVRIERLPAAWTNARYELPPGDDWDVVAAERYGTDIATLHEALESTQVAWFSFMGEEEDALGRSPDREIQMWRGQPLPYVRLLEVERMHAAQHYRQVTTHLRSSGRRVPAFDPLDLKGLELPKAIY